MRDLLTAQLTEEFKQGSTKTLKAIVSGEPVKTLRTMYDKELDGTKRVMQAGDIVGFAGGHKSRCPYDIGILDKDVWGIISE